MTDNALAECVGVRVAFTERSGGVSAGSYASLNLGNRVQDDPAAVEVNRARLLDALDAGDCVLVNPIQVHGSEVVQFDTADLALRAASCPDGFEADGIIVRCADVAALLCFADCVPVIIVAPNGHFAVVHAGWRGVAASIAPKALRLLAQDSDAPETGFSPALRLSDCNIYIGPHIGAECFETGEDVHARFVAGFGSDCAFDSRRIDLSRALRNDLVAAGADEARILDCGLCTVCENERFFSYRAQDGVCGRHGALAFRRAR